MLYIIILAVLFVIMLLAPFILAISYCKNRKGSILKIQQERTKDPRYFGKSFAELIEKNISSVENGQIYLSKEEEIRYGDSEKQWPQRVEEVVLCLEEDFYSSTEVAEFEKEIYGAQNVVIQGASTALRGAYAKKKMVLGNNTRVERWVDAEETLAIYDDCNLGMSASAGRRMSIGNGCAFRRLYAPEILVGQYPNQSIETLPDKKLFAGNETKKPEIVRNISYVNQEMTQKNGIADVTVITKNDISILENITVRGDVRSHKSVRLCDNAIVCGNVFAEKDIFIGKEAVVMGNVFAQGNIYIEEKAVIGEKGEFCSIIARGNIRFGKDIRVYGYVSCEGIGKVEWEQWEKEERKQEFLPLPEYRTEIYIDNPEEFHKEAGRGFRKEEFIQKAEIKVKITEIPKSMFFSCKSLKEVVLPKTIEQIGAYGFADCISLKEITSFSNMRLKTIATSAFENCKEIESVAFPQSLEILGNAAFSGCTALKKVEFSPKSKLKTMGDQCFKGCENLEQIELPDTVEKIGISAFADCKKLKLICVPESCKSEPGIVQLQQLDGIEVQYRALRKEKR